MALAVQIVHVLLIFFLRNRAVSCLGPRPTGACPTWIDWATLATAKRPWRRPFSMVSPRPRAHADWASGDRQSHAASCQIRPPRPTWSPADTERTRRDSNSGKRETAAIAYVDQSEEVAPVDQRRLESHPRGGTGRHGAARGGTGRHGATRGGTGRQVRVHVRACEGSIPSAWRAYAVVEPV